MPAPIDKIVKRRVVQQWLAGEALEKIIADNDIAAGTVSIIVDDYKQGSNEELVSRIISKTCYHPKTFADLKAASLIACTGVFISCSTS
jgi:hypothetical protein